MANRIQTTFTFNTELSARQFEIWLKMNRDKTDCGSPRLVDTRNVGYGWCVEYVGNGDFARGIATGIEFVENNLKIAEVL